MVQRPVDYHERRADGRRPEAGPPTPSARVRTRGRFDRAPERESAGGSGTSEGSTAASEHYVLDRILELLERRGLSVTEMRVLLALHEREATIADLAEQLGQRSGATWRAGRALSARGLARWHQVGRRRRTAVAITPAGLVTLRPFLTAAGRDGPSEVAMRHAMSGRDLR